MRFRPTDLSVRCVGGLDGPFGRLGSWAALRCGTTSAGSIGGAGTCTCRLHVCHVDTSATLMLAIN